VTDDKNAQNLIEDCYKCIQSLLLQQPKWISVKDRLPKTNMDVYCEDGQVHFHTSYGWSDQEPHHYLLDCKLPTTEESTAVEEG